MKRSYRRRPAATASERQQPFFQPVMRSPLSGQPLPFFQAKGLKVGAPGDRYEQQADTMADVVVNASVTTPTVQKREISMIQRESLATPLEDEKPGTAEQRMEGDKLVQEKPELQMRGEEEEEPTVQTKGEAGVSTTRASLTHTIESSAGQGKPLPTKTRGEMQAAFGADFSSVSIHTDDNSVQMNRELGAQAFTHGSDIYFNQGKYRPETSEGKHLLAHELTHVVQQNDRNNISQVQTKISIDNKPVSKSDQLIKGLLQKYKIKKEGKQALRQMFSSKHVYHFKSREHLAYELQIIDNTLSSAKEVSKKVGFAELGKDGKAQDTLAPKYWIKKESGTFEAKTDDYAKAIDAIFSGTSKSALECMNLTEVMSLRSLQKAVGDKKFNQLLKKKLGKKKFTISMNEELVEGFERDDDNPFQVGDRVLFSATRLDAPDANPQWFVENAIVVKIEKGKPMFMGGGLKKVYTEEGMKREMCKYLKVKCTKDTMDKIVLYPSTSRLSFY